MFWNARLVTSLNPKGIVFFIAYVPQFVEPAQPALIQFAIREATFVIMAMLNAALCAVLAGQMRPRFRRPETLRLVNRALDGVTQTTALHICFGYTHVVHEGKNDGYKFLTELEECIVDQVSIEAAQPKLDLSILDGLPSKTIMVGVIDMGDPNVETADVVADRVRNALKHVPAERLTIAPD